MSITKCVKTLFFLPHVILCISDICVIFVLAYLIRELWEYKTFLPLIIFGPIICIFGLNVIEWFGFWRGFSGIQKANRKFVLIFCFFLVVCTIADVFVGIWTVILRNDLNFYVHLGCNNSFENYAKVQYNKEEWNTLQANLKCCGTTGPKSFFDYGSEIIPIACCNVTTNDRTCTGELYKTGCVDELTTFTDQQLYYFTVVVFLFVAIQIIGIAIFCHLNAILNKHLVTSKYSFQERNLLKRRSLPEK